MISSIIQALFLIKIQPNMSKQEKKQQRIYDLHNTKTKPEKISKIIEISLFTVYKAKQSKAKFSLQKKIFLRIKGSGGLNKKNEKKAFQLLLLWQ